MIATTAVHFDQGFTLNKFAWVTNCWEQCLVSQIGHLESLTAWLKEIRSRWPDARCLTLGEFGELWRKQFRNNDTVNYRFVQRGTGIGGSDKDKEIRWYMNKEFRLAVLRDLTADAERVIDLTRYDTAVEPDGYVESEAHTPTGQPGTIQWTHTAGQGIHCPEIP
jgi:hypothetical protein